MNKIHHIREIHKKKPTPGVTRMSNVVGGIVTKGINPPTNIQR